jgi:HD-GYP domain-containing protein (c-di-GMP phosphodiesterase class II)
MKEASNFGTFSPTAFLEHFAQDSTLARAGPQGRALLPEQPEVPLQSLIAVPLRMKQRVLGWIGVVSYTKGKRFDEGQRKLLSIVASRAAAAIENARLYEDLQATFQQTIEGSPRPSTRWTATRRATPIASPLRDVLATKLGLSIEQIEIVRQSALMHDIGKIGCVLNLNKPGKLTQDEYEIFKKHPGYGRDILEPIKFLHPLIPGVHLHHERWDGRGYPLGLKGKDVPLIARIIAVADTYDAMTSDRAYRRALPHEVAVTEIERCSGDAVRSRGLRGAVSGVQRGRPIETPGSARSNDEAHGDQSDGLPAVPGSGRDDQRRGPDRLRWTEEPAAPRRRGGRRAPTSSCRPPLPSHRRLPRPHGERCRARGHGRPRARRFVNRLRIAVSQPVSRVIPDT